MRYKLFALILLAVIPGLATGCKHGRANSSSSVVTGNLKTFSIRGRIVSVDTGKGMVMLDGQAVPGFMDAMTMAYKLKDKGIATELHPGDQITANLLVHKTSEGYEDPQLDEIDITGQARPDYKPAVQYHVPTPGDVVPDFKLVNQNGRTIHLGQFKGKELLLTFIYTRCPLPDYCPRMNENFAQIDKALKADSAEYSKTHLLSISFDPKHDTPEVLKIYGQAYAGAGTNFSHWDFAAPRPNDLKPMLEFFGVGVTPGENGTLTHSLSTVLIGADGKIVAWYPSNDWSVADVLKTMKTAASS